MNEPIYDIPRSNRPTLDDMFTDSKGRRVYFHEDGRPYVQDSLGRKITRFKGAENWKPFVVNDTTTSYRPFSNMITYEIQGLDNDGNIIKSNTYKTEMVDIMDYKTRRMADAVEKDIRKNAFDYVLSKKIMQAHKDFVDKGIQVRGLQISTFVDGVHVANHLTEGGKVMPHNMTQGYHYTTPTVFDPMGIRWKDWSLPEVLSNESLARQHRAGDGRDYLSLRGVGIQNPKEIDKDAVKRLFNQDYGSYAIYDAEDYKRLHFTNTKVEDLGTSPDGKPYIEGIQFIESEEAKSVAPEKPAPIVNENPLHYTTPDVITKFDEATARRNMFANDPAYAAVQKNLKEYEEMFVGEARRDAVSPPKYDPELEKARVAFERKYEDIDIDEYNQKRLRMTRDIQDEFGGYEAYQKADKVFTQEQLNEAFQRKEVLLNSYNGRYYLDGEDSVTQYLSETYNTKGEPVYAALRSNDTKTDLHLNVHEYTDEETNQKFIYDAVTLEDIEHDRIRISSENEKSLFVLTDIGQQKMEQAQKLAIKVKDHNAIIDEIFATVKSARDSNTEERIFVNEELRRTFGIETDTLTSNQMYIETSKYMAHANAQGMTNITLSDADIRNGRAFQNLLGYMYQAKGERHPVWDEIKKWNGVASNLRDERIGLLREFNVEVFSEITGEASQYASNEEIHRAKQDGTMERMYEDRTKVRDILEENDKMLSQINESLQETGETGKRAKRELMDEVIQGTYMQDADAPIKRQMIHTIMEQGEAGKPITRSTFHNMRIGAGAEEEVVRGAYGLDDITRNESNRLYDSILDDINKQRVNVGMPALRALDTESVKEILNTPEPVKKWQALQEELESKSALYRRQGDYSLYNITKVLEDGAVIAEPLSAPAQAVRMQLSFDNPDYVRPRTDIVLDLETSNDMLIPKADSTPVHELTPQEVERLTKDRHTFVTALRKGEDGMDSYSRVLRDNTIMQSLLSRDETIRFKSGRQANAATVINKRLYDITASRAGWMLRSNNMDDMASNIALAFYETLTERGQLDLTDKGKYRAMDEVFEDMFTKNLHKAYFDMKDIGGGYTSAADSFIMDVAEHVDQYMTYNPDISPAENDARRISEVHRLITEQAGDAITEKYSYYNEALDANKISQVLQDNRDNPRNVSSLDAMVYEKEMKRVGDEDLDAGSRADAAENYDTRAIGAEVLDSELRESTDNASDLTSKTTKETGFITEGQIRHHYFAMDNIQNDLAAIKAGKGDELGDMKTTRKLLGDEYVDELLNSSRMGKVTDKFSDWNVFNQYYKQTLLPQYGGEGAYQMVQNLYDYSPNPGDLDMRPVLNEGFWQGVHKEILEPTITSPDRLRNYMELVESIPSMKAEFTIDRSMISDDLKEMFPAEDTFHVFVGNKGDLMMRSNMTNHMLQITGMKNGKEDKMVTVFNAYSEAPRREGIVAKLPAIDGTRVMSPAETLPIAINTPYNSNRINRSPGGVGYMASSDIGTRSAVHRILEGKRAVGFDFETTGFMDSSFLSERGIVLPTEAFYQSAKMEDGKLVLGDQKHVFLDVGAQTDVNGTTVRDIVTKELGGLNSSDLIQETLGDQAKRWDMLTPQQQLKVMKNDKVALLRNLAKYSNQLSEGDMANVTNFDYRPTSFMNEYKNLVKHATIGMDNLSAGTVKAGATYAKTLEEFMQIHNEQTDRRVLVAQNGADADLRWAKHFAEKAGVKVDNRPVMAEMIHMSRLLNPGESRHNMLAQIERSNIPGLLQDYKSGSHLADVDTVSMMRLFGEEYLPKMQAQNLHEVEFLRPGQSLMRLGSTGSNKLPHDLYTVVQQSKSDIRGTNGTYNLTLEDVDGERHVVSAPSLQELQRNISQNYKAFNSPADADKFLKDLTFDDAREDVHAAMNNYNAMVREQNRARGGDTGRDIGMQNLRRRYDKLQKDIDEGMIDPANLSTEDMKVIQNANAISTEKMMKYGEMDYSSRQRRAMKMTNDFFTSEDANMRMAFLGELENLKAAGVINKSDSAVMLDDYNKRIKERAAAIGRGPLEKEVPGLVDLGITNGEQFKGKQGIRLTAMANTYDQAERSLWEIANNFKELTSPVAQESGRWKGQAVQMLTDHLKNVGIMSPTAGTRMEDAVDAVMNELQMKGNMKVEDITDTYISGAYKDEMRQIFQEAHDEIINPRLQQMTDRPDQLSTYQATKELRDSLAAQDSLVHGFDFKVSGDYQGEHLPMTGKFAMRHANDLMEEINALKEMSNQDVVYPRINELWNEVYRRATDKGTWDDELGERIYYSDRDAAQSHLGWDSTPDNYIHPSDTKNYPAGTRYADMEERHIRQIMDRSERPEIKDRTREYLNAAFGENGVEREFVHVNPSQIEQGITVDDILEAEAQKAEASDLYVEERLWDRPDGSNRPPSELQELSSRAREQASNVRRRLADMLPSKGMMGLLALGAGVGYVGYQWSRGDMVTPESKPQHDQAPDVTGNYDQQSYSNPNMPQPDMGGKTYLKENGVNINVQANNRSGVTQEQMDAAIQRVMDGTGASVTVQHQDDTTSINGSWLMDKFAQLIDTGLAK